MKRAWIALGLIAASLIIGGIDYIYTATAAKIYTDMLTEGDAHMEQNEAYEAQSLTERLDHRFNEDRQILHIFSFHSDVNVISNDLAAMRRFSQTGNTADYLATSAQAREDPRPQRDAHAEAGEYSLTAYRAANTLPAAAYLMKLTSPAGGEYYNINKNCRN